MLLLLLLLLAIRVRRLLATRSAFAWLRSFAVATKCKRINADANWLACATHSSVVICNFMRFISIYIYLCIYVSVSMTFAVRPMHAADTAALPHGKTTYLLPLRLPCLTPCTALMELQCLS